MRDLEEFAMLIAGYVGSVRATRKQAVCATSKGWRAKLEPLPCAEHETPAVRVTLHAGIDITVSPTADAESTMRQFLL